MQASGSTNQDKARPYEYDVIDIDSLRKTATMLAKRRTRWTMLRVPRLMYQVNPLAYTPQFVSIGPYHRHNDNSTAASFSHGNADLQAMEGHKRVFMLHLLERTKSPDDTFRECKDAVNRAIEMLSNNHYAELDISSELLAKIILVDACFLLEVFLKHSGITNSRISCRVEAVVRDNEYMNIFTSSCLRRDLALLENQLPFFVLELLFDIIYRNLAVPTDMEHVCLFEIAFAVFKSDFNCHLDPFGIVPATKHPDYRHLLDLISYYARPSLSSRCSHLPFRPPVSLISPIVHLRNAKRLREAGIHFERARESMLLEIEFCNGVVRIPPLVINECTESLLRNLMAFEHNSCNPPDPADPHYGYFASYVFLMERLVSHKEDLDILESKGIIINQMGGREDAYKIFYNISQNFVLKNFYFSGLCSSIETYCDSRGHRYLLELRRKHLKSPWTTLSVVGVTILLIFTAIQTIYTVLGYLHH